MTFEFISSFLCMLEASSAWATTLEHSPVPTHSTSTSLKGDVHLPQDKFLRQVLYIYDIIYINNDIIYIYIYIYIYTYIHIDLHFLSLGNKMSSRPRSQSCSRPSTVAARARMALQSTAMAITDVPREISFTSRKRSRHIELNKNIQTYITYNKYITYI